MHHLLRSERMIEHVIGRREGTLGVAAAQPVIERDVGAGATFQVLQVGKRTGVSRLMNKVL